MTSHKPRKSTAEALERLDQILAADADIGFREACAKAGINYRSAYRYHGPSGRQGKGCPGFDKETAFVAFEAACEHMGIARPTSQQYQRLAPPQISHMTLYRLFGSWDAVLEAASREPYRWWSVGLPAKMRLTHADLKRLEVL